MNIKIYYGAHMVYETNKDIGFSDEKAVCEELFEQFNIGDHGGKRIRSMSVGDKVVFNDSVAYIVAPVGWHRIEEK